jgi:signal transduction histidine kinase
MRTCLHYVIGLFMLFNSTMGFSQSNVIDSLEKALPYVNNHEEKLKTINRLLEEYRDTNAIRSRELGLIALSLAEKSSNQEEIANTYLNWGIACEAMGDYAQSIEYHHKALTAYTILKDSVGVAAALNNIGIGYNQLGDYGMAAHYILRAIDIDVSLHDSIGIASDYINLAEAYFNALNYDLAKRYISNARALLEKRKDDVELLGYAYESLSSILMEEKKLDSSRYFIQRTNEIAKTFNNEYLELRSLLLYGRYYYSRVQLDSAKHYLIGLIEASEDNYQSDILMPAIKLLVKCYIVETDWKSAERKALQGLTAAQKIKSIPYAVDFSSLLAEIYQNIGDENKAILYLKNTLAHKDSMLIALRHGSIESRTVDLSLQKEKRENQSLLTHSAIREKLLSRQRLALFALFGLAASLLVVVWLVRKASLDRRRANALLTKKNEELNQLNREVNGLIDAMVHDLKSPLNSVQGLLHLIQMEGEENEKIKLYVDKGHDVIKSGHNLIAGLLELKELEDNPLEMKYECVRLDTYLKDIIDYFRERADQKSITVQLSCDELTTSLEPTYLKRILDNLISNAIKYSPHQRNVFVEAKITNQVLHLNVRDEGPGFQAKDLNKVFGKFQKLSARPTGGESSHGLGLAIVQLIVSYLKGTIELESKFGEGATFKLKIPTKSCS